MKTIIIEEKKLRLSSDLSLVIDSMELQPNIYLVKGKNGSGKSVFLRHLAKLTKESESFIKNGSQNILYLTNEEVTFPNLTIEENLRINQDIFGITASLKTSLFLPEQLTRLCKQASVGMRHKVGLSLTVEPLFWDLIILDETMSNIDSSSRKQVLKELNKRRKEGTIILIVDHNLTDEETKFKCIVVEEGKIYER